jgi:hypothetical protein
VLSISSKPNAIRPINLDEDLPTVDDETQALQTMFSSSSRPPSERYEFPMTTSQEIGFQNNGYIGHDLEFKRNPRFNYGNKKSEITKFGEALFASGAVKRG